MTTFQSSDALFKINLKALEKTHPSLSGQLIHHVPSADFRWIDTQTPDPSLELISTKEQDSILFHSRHDPKQEALRQIKPLALDSPVVYIFAGIGLGYSLECLWEEYPTNINSILLIEKDIEILYYLLHRLDWSLLLVNPRIRIILTDAPERILDDIQPFLPHIMGCGVRIIDHQPSFKRHPKYYSATIELIRQYLQRAAAESEFLIQHGGLIQRNAILNLPAMCSSHGLGPLRGHFRNQPAILIGAGPSLNKNLHHLVSEHSELLVFCVDTAYKMVREIGISPDFVAAADPTELNLKHFEGIDSDTQEVLIFESDVYPDIPRLWKGPSIFLNSEKTSINRWIEDIAGPFGIFDQGLSVAHTLYNAAAWMQCNPIVLIGFDLAYPPEGGTTHAQGTVLNRKVAKAKIEEERVSIGPADFHPGESKEKIEWVLGVRGDHVPTSKTMAIFLKELSSRIKKSDITVFDATEGGALIEGTIPTLLSRILPTLDRNKNVNDIAPFLKDHQDPQEIRRLKAFDLLLEGLESATRLAQDGLKQTRTLLQSADVNLRNKPEWEEIDRLFWIVYRDQSIQTALGQALFSSLFLFIRQEKGETDQDRLKKYDNVFDSIIRLSKEFIPYLRASREIIEKSCQGEAL